MGIIFKDGRNMRRNEYKYKFYLNATHSIYINNIMGDKHPHTWEITIDTIKIVEGFVQFNHVEQIIEKILEKYQDSYINEVEPFITLNPTLENICIYFKEDIKRDLMEIGWLLLSIEISETPSRSYLIDLMDEEDTTIAVKNAKKYVNDEKSLESKADELLENIINKGSI